MPDLPVAVPRMLTGNVAPVNNPKLRGEDVVALDDDTYLHVAVPAYTCTSCGFATSMCVCSDGPRDPETGLPVAVPPNDSMTQSLYQRSGEGDPEPATAGVEPALSRDLPVAVPNHEAAILFALDEYEADEGQTFDSVDAARVSLRALLVGLRQAEKERDLYKAQLDAVDANLPWESEPDSTTEVVGRVQAILNLKAERERDRQHIEQHYDELLDAERRALDYQEFIAWTLDEFGARMPEAWKTRARAALSGEEEG